MPAVCLVVVTTGPRAGGECGRPAKARVVGNMPICGVHARAAEARGDETRPL